jgi:transposase
MKKSTRWVAMDVHADTIAVAVADGDEAPTYYGEIENTPTALAKLMKKLTREAKVRVCYEAGPCGYRIYWQLAQLDVHCDVIAPTLIPKKSGDRIKTDRRDALKLARFYRSGDLTPIWVPDQSHEALRELVRLRAAAKKDQHRSRRRTVQFLMRYGYRKPKGVTSWRLHFVTWVKAIKFDLEELRIALADLIAETEHQDERVRRIEESIDDAIARAPEQTRALIEGLQAMRGVATVVAATIVSELGNFTRFAKPAQLMAYSGAVPSERSSGDHTHRGGITKAGNGHLRRVLIEAAWAYRSPPKMYHALRRRQRNVDPRACEIAWKAQHRLHRRFQRLLAIGKAKPKALTAIARELLGFIWAIGTHIERTRAEQLKAA